MVESLLKEYPNILVLRVRMPIVGDLTYTRNFISKIIRYDKVSSHLPLCLPANLCSMHVHVPMRLYLHVPFLHRQIRGTCKTNVVAHAQAYNALIIVLSCCWILP